MLEAEGFAVHAPALPAREPTDDTVLSRTGIEQCLAVALDAYDRIDAPAIVLGHSVGGLLAQRIAAVRSPRAVVLLASVPQGVLWPRLRSLPHLVPILPKVIAGNAGSDENVAPWISRRIARRYRAEQVDHPGLPHWVIAESAIGHVAPPVLAWLRRKAL